MVEEEDNGRSLEVESGGCDDGVDGDMYGEEGKEDDKRRCDEGARTGRQGMCCGMGTAESRGICHRAAIADDDDNNNDDDDEDDAYCIR